MLKLSDIVEEDKIGLSRLIPKNTRKGFPIETSEDKSKIIVKAKVKRGRLPKPLMLNKFVSFDFCKFLGLFQAESEKFLNRKGGSGFAFTNVNIKLCKLVVDSLLELGISKEEIKVRILIPSNWDKKK